MLTILSVLLIVLGLALNRRANRYFRFHRESADTSADSRHSAGTLRRALRHRSAQLLALFGYFLGLFLIFYGALNLAG